MKTNTTSSSKALFLDLDGTLLNDQKEVTPGNREAIEKALAAGNKVIISTGRPLVSAIDQAEKLGLTTPGCYLIAFNGCILYDTANKEIIYSISIPLDLKASKYELYLISLFTFTRLEEIISLVAIRMKLPSFSNS